ncbi:hypothetical protein [Streptomyces lacrimifluminis]|uniref:hypothetical protein n=1 Tax=Streptomyces lacrimifluminis TaxID=1500077 RepID=UPI00166BA486|nr:hypothetical protein [Streptomyces lacrimifluminis]
MRTPSGTPSSLERASTRPAGSSETTTFAVLGDRVRRAEGERRVRERGEAGDEIPTDVGEVVHTSVMKTSVMRPRSPSSTG